VPIDLDQLEQRIVGTLIEKQWTVPEAYPLTRNALLAGCNQKSNRDPEMSVEEYQVEGALRALMERGWVVEVERDGGRTRRYSHQVDRQLGVERADLALLSELLCRGPQSPSELRVRASRMAPFASPEEVERRLEALAARPVPFVRRLERRPREHAARWEHLLGSRPEAPAKTPAATSAPASERPPDLATRLGDLERVVSDLAARLARLEPLNPGDPSTPR
jgi:hypothetical protein